MQAERAQSLDTHATSRAVSCLAISLFSDYAQQHGIPEDHIFAGLPYPREHLANRLKWIDYPTFQKIERRVARVFHDDPQVFFKVGLTAASRPTLGFVRSLSRAVLSPYQVYRQVARLTPRFLFPFLDIEFHRSSATLIRASYVFRDDCPASQAFSDTVRGILSAVPTMMGAPQAQVSVISFSEQVIVFEIELVRWFGPGESLRRLWSRVSSTIMLRWANRGEQARDLEQSNTLLLEQVDALEAAKRTLDHKLSDLGLLHRLATTATNQLDLRVLVRNVASEISGERGGLPVVILMSDDGTRLTIGATAGLELKLLREVERELRFGGVLPPLDDDSPARFPMAGSQWTAAPLRGPSQLHGVLVLGDKGTWDTALIESMARQITVAVDNARSYRTIRALRDGLELRVEERTFELEEARRRLEDTIVQLEQASHAKQDFFTNVSHELKTPLTLILAPLDECAPLLDESSPASDLLRVASRSARQLRAMVEELLDFSRLDGGQLQLRLQPVDMTLLAADVVQTLRPLAERRHIDLRLVPPPTAIPTLADPRLSRRVLVNLVGNAIKYVDEGDRVRVRVERGDGQVRIAVVDNGPGIPEADRDKVFERFHRSWNPQGRSVAGSGIGLAMAREIARLHGGDLTLEPTTTRGSTFVFSLPSSEAAALQVGGATEQPVEPHGPDSLDLFDTADPESDESPGSEEADVSHERVLIVEDNIEMRNFLRRMLSAHFRVRTAPDGVEGLRLATEILPDLVLSDVQMPGMDGLEMCRQLKAAPATRNIPVVLVSARPGETAAVEGFQAGADDYVVKPFSAPELIARVRAQLRLRSLSLALIRAEKQAQVGMMAAGIAHEVLNPVNVVVNAAGLLRQVVPSAVQAGPDAPSASWEQMVGLIEDAGDRIRRVVDGVLKLARHDEDELHLQSARLSERLPALIDLLGPRLRGGIQVQIDVAWDEPLLCYPDLVDQVVMNLIGNAADALGGTGHILVRVEADDEVARIHVQDDGPGIPPQLRERIFTPFFTTKDPGKGTGLGLALCAEIAQLHGGSLSLLSPEQGAEFVLTLPRGLSSPDGGTDEPGDHAVEAATP